MYAMHYDVYNAIGGVIGVTKKWLHIQLLIVSILFDFVCSDDPDYRVPSFKCAFVFNY